MAMARAKVRKVEVGTLNDLVVLGKKMEEEGWELDRIEGNDTDGYYAIFVRRDEQ